MRPESQERSRQRGVGALALIATPIGHLQDITLRAVQTLNEVDAVLCEDTRVSAVLLAAHHIQKPLWPYHDHNADQVRPGVLEKLEAGARLALISDAGTPLIADPGFKLVRACRARGIPVTALPGANAALTALTLSALPTAPFVFAGFLPNKSTARRNEMLRWRDTPATLIFYETPQRIVEALQDAAELLPGRTAVIARELTKMFEEVRAGAPLELAQAIAEKPLKGELVLLFSPPEETPADEAALDAALRATLETLKLRDAVAQVTDALKLPRKQVYARALELQGRR